MSRLIILLCLTLGIVMTGCGGDEKGKSDKGGDKGTAADKAASGSKDTTDKKEGGGDKKDAKPGDGASVGKSGDMQMVSLKLPNMTWGGCERSVQSALTKAGVFKDLKTDLKKTTATFKVSADVDFKTKLDEIVAGGNTHVKGYEVETAAPAKGDGASLQNAGSMQFVSVNKTGDCCASKKACETGDSESSFVTVSTVVDDEEKKEEKKTKTVSLKLPNMTWGGCERSVRSALTKAGIFKDLKTDVKAHTATFAVSTGVDFKKKLDAIVADGNRHVKGYEVATKKDDKKDDKKEKPKTKTVSLKLPNMTWGGCERSVRSALTKAGVFKDLKTDVKSNSATFKVSADLNFKKKLDEIVADGNKHVKGYKIEKKKKDVKKKTVSLKLPNMTWGGCERSVRSALTKAGVFSDLKTDVKANTATFAVSADLDFKKKLDEIVKAGNKHVKGYEVKK